eukprot:CAMPEP_0179069278 /NCGR_PEP_ID=MMETSP0796-20121207/30426_1 /TAXON_ID=73915 /ORGANISM="Pyrodinium bahamense, Strain pbaha01" /LENGTH=204 /DNA_ID=CAMNT_0020766341 /DNA_START=70 /DNA_END=684 /DNA_ORIENTATION=-
MAMAVCKILQVAAVLALCSAAPASGDRNLEQCQGQEICAPGSLVGVEAVRSAGMTKPLSLLQINAGTAEKQAAAGGAQHEEPLPVEQKSTEASTGQAAPQAAQIAPFGKEDTARELQSHAARTQDTLVDAVENAEVAEIKRAVFRALTRLRAAEIKEFDTIARLETQAIDEYNDAHHYRAENPLGYLSDNEPKVSSDKYTSFHD